MKTKIFACSKTITFAAAIMLTVVLLSFLRNRRECSRILYQRFEARGITDAMLVDFANSVQEECKLKHFTAVVRVGPASQARNVGPILAVFDKEREIFDVAALNLNKQEWIITISLFRTRVWEREGQLVIKPTATSREAFDQYLSIFSGRKVYSDNVVGICIPPKM